MRCLILFLGFIWYLPFLSFSGTLQLNPKPPTAYYTHKENSRITLADFDANPFDYEVTTELLLRKLSNKFRLFKEIVKNTHNPQLRDTIFHFSCLNTKLKIYKSKDNEMVFSAQISDNQIELRNQIRIGMTKDELFAKFTELEKYKYFQGIAEVQGNEEADSYELIIQPNLVKITNSMGTADYVFVFQNNILSQVNINIYMD
ncbi:MAG: hypothetical protein MUE81_14915 [Thermoflexibacter sp.]|jgi:hypothetical protein|nr:hypothetical protein [Thermoflexibacter sp.]